mmetsp:Transcript_106670/g.299690  ORF Transcript_106670/g.299690 Transcript_106670/m.299690 type:complete len:256 (-) Transcript_106670:128-895(-)
MGYLITLWLDALYDRFDCGGSHKNIWSFQLYMLAANVLVSLYPLTCYFTICQNVHVLFWVGAAPGYVTLLVPAMVFTLNFVFGFLQCAKRDGAKTKASCVSTLTMMGVVFLVAGSYVTWLAYDSTMSLTQQCGKDGLTKRVQSKWDELRRFHEECCKRKGMDDVFIQQCKGFGSKFGDNFYAEYLEDLEYDYDCQGFCQFWARPLFNENGELGRRCVVDLGQEVVKVVYIVGLPSMGFGVFLLLSGACVFGYQHL